MSQDIIERFLKENSFTLESKNNIYEKKIEKLINKENRVIDKNKTIYTILIIYYCLNIYER